ncbi:hypothetical protein [Demequina zhanjiangensis]|uniref:DUF4328 domain-containing protein n=1 Tax=Demequina zhanjiangensis TaxID=3051659 RepID=A0ABT8FX46_9MICO|nr:hypothetical protein [Demequina sp. SYSU T00b26]MDN4471377.1 hypothetical protein [Demequina sp. SYSU T00b26]
MTMGDDAARKQPGTPVAAPVRQRAEKGTLAIWATAAYAFLWAGTNGYYLIAGQRPSDNPYLLSMVAGVVSWIALSEWTCRVAEARRERGTRLPSNAWIWFAWLIPVVSLFSPAKTISKLELLRPVRIGLLLAWWLPWLVANQLSFRGHAEHDASTLVVETIAIVVSWLALQAIIRRISDDSVI